MADTTHKHHPTTLDNVEPAVLRPRIDMLETDDEVLLYADLPGVRPTDVDIRFENGELTIHGRRQSNHVGKTKLFVENDSAHYHRSFRLDENIAADKIAAEMKNGVLTIRLPKAEAAKPRKITVTG
jgi:HSP20 family protein